MTAKEVLRNLSNEEKVKLLLAANKTGMDIESQLVPVFEFYINIIDKSYGLCKKNVDFLYGSK